jgi:CRP/FNR family transcriptional regulator
MDASLIAKLDTFFQQFPKQLFKKGDIIIPAGKDPTGVFYITQGVIRSYIISEDGTEITLNMYKPHTFLPMSFAIGNVPVRHFYEALTPTVSTQKAPKELFLSFIKHQPDVLFDLLRRIYIGMEGLWSHIESLTSGNASTKLLVALIILAKRFGETNKSDIVISIRLSEADIANYAGISRETASRQLQKLKKDQLVTFEKGTITVHNLQKLEEYSSLHIPYALQ